MTPTDQSLGDLAVTFLFALAFIAAGLGAWFAWDWAADRRYRRLSEERKHHDRR